MKSKIQYRAAVIAAADRAADPDGVRLAFSTAAPVDMGGYVEILEHGPDNIRLSRLENGAPVLLDHDRRIASQVGVVESVEVTKGVGRALVRFGASAKAREILADVQGGILRNVSVGYRVHAWTEDQDGTVRVTDWEPLEISIVTVPADESAGVGRACADSSHKATTTTKETPEMDPKENPKQDEAARTTEPNPSTPTATPSGGSEADRGAEIARARELLAIGSRMGRTADAERAVTAGETVEAFKARMFDAAPARPMTNPEPSDDMNLTAAERRQYNVAAALRSLIDPRDRKAAKAAGFAFEVSEEAARREGREVQGLYIPRSLLTQQRDAAQNTATAGQGGELVNTSTDLSRFIDQLKNALITRRLGVQFIDGLVGNADIPRQTGGASAYYVGEVNGSDVPQEPTASRSTFDQVQLRPHTIGARVPITRRLMKQTDGLVERIITDRVAFALAEMIDKEALYGDGAGLAVSGVATFAAANPAVSNVPTWSEVVGLESAVTAANALQNGGAYAMGAQTWGVLKTAPKDTGSGQFILEDGEVNGYAAHRTNLVTADDLFFGDWSQLIIGQWGGVDLTVDPYTLSDSGAVKVIGFTDFDVQAEHAAAFAYSTRPPAV